MKGKKISKAREAARKADAERRAKIKERQRK